jgi:hypothetical protein
MKTTHEIVKKVDKLRKKLILKARTNGLYENFGEKEERELKDFIGDIYDYPYPAREGLWRIERSFFNWSSNFNLSDLKEGRQ